MKKEIIIVVVLMLVSVGILSGCVGYEVESTNEVKNGNTGNLLDGVVHVEYEFNDWVWSTCYLHFTFYDEGDYKLEISYNNNSLEDPPNCFESIDVKVVNYPHKYSYGDKYICNPVVSVEKDGITDSISFDVHVVAFSLNDDFRETVLSDEEKDAIYFVSWMQEKKPIVYRVLHKMYEKTMVL